MSRIQMMKDCVLEKYKNGNILFDTECNEVFKFDLDTDYVAIFNHPDRFRIATDYEKSRLEQSGKDHVKFKNKPKSE